MIARAALPFTLRHFLDRVGLGSIRQRSGPVGWLRLNRLQGLFAALGDWSSGSDLARAAQLFSATDPSGSTVSAEIAGRILRMRALTSAAPAGMRRFAVAGTADGNA